MRRIILLLIGFYVSTPGFSQSRLNGAEPFYDKAAEVFPFSISEDSHYRPAVARRLTDSVCRGSR